MKENFENIIGEYAEYIQKTINDNQEYKKQVDIDQFKDALRRSFSRMSLYDQSELPGYLSNAKWLKPKFIKQDLAEEFFSSIDVGTKFTNAVKIKTSDWAEIINGMELGDRVFYGTRNINNATIMSYRIGKYTDPAYLAELSQATPNWHGS